MLSEKGFPGLRFVVTGIQLSSATLKRVLTGKSKQEISRYVLSHYADEQNVPGHHSDGQRLLGHHCGGQRMQGLEG